MAIYMVIKMQ